MTPPRAFTALCLIFAAIGIFASCIHKDARLTFTNPQHPDHSMTATLPSDDPKVILPVLDLFGKKHNLKSAFGFRLSAFGYRSPDGKDFLLQMSLNGMAIIVANSRPQNIYEVGSYIDQPTNKAQPMTGELMDELRADLESIPGAEVKVDY